MHDSLIVMMMSSTKTYKYRIFCFLSAMIITYGGIVANATVNQPAVNKATIFDTVAVNSSAVPSAECESTHSSEREEGLVGRLVSYMKARNYQLDKAPGRVNIVYIEGACRDGRPNRDESDIFNDRRILLKYEDGVPQIVGNWLSTTEPGTYYTRNPLQKAGAAMIAFAQHKNSWGVGDHTGPSGRNTHEGLIQRRPVGFHRDSNRDGLRNSNEPVQTGSPGLNQHQGAGSSRQIGRNSAGCPVGWNPEGHIEFMSIVKSDPRYVNNRNYLFTTTFINGDELAEEQPIIE